MPKNKELLFSITKKDFEIVYFSGTGAGGQYRNKHQNCVRLRHKESGAITTGQSYRERSRNLTEAFNNMLGNAGFKLWYNYRVQEALRDISIEEAVEQDMKPENIKVEVKDELGRWIEADENSF